MTALERAEQLARRQELYEARWPETKKGAAGGAATAAKAKRNDFALPSETPAEEVVEASDDWLDEAPVKAPGSRPSQADYLTSLPP